MWYFLWLTLSQVFTSSVYRLLFKFLTRALSNFLKTNESTFVVEDCTYWIAKCSFIHQVSHLTGLAWLLHHVQKLPSIAFRQTPLDGHHHIKNSFSLCVTIYVCVCVFYYSFFFFFAGSSTWAWFCVRAQSGQSSHEIVRPCPEQPLTHLSAHSGHHGSHHHRRLQSPGQAAGWRWLGPADDRDRRLGQTTGTDDWRRLEKTTGTDDKTTGTDDWNSWDRRLGQMTRVDDWGRTQLYIID